MAVSKNSFKALLRDTSGCTPVPVVAKEGIVSLLISILATRATASGTSYESLLRFLILFLAVLGIIHYSLIIIEKLRRKKAKLEDIQAANTRKVLKNLSSARTALERLIQERSEVTELRTLRNRLTTLIFEVQNPNLEKFKRKDASVEEFNAAERALVEASERLNLELEGQNGADVAATVRLVDAVEEAVRTRVPVTDELKDLYVKNIENQRREKSSVPKDAASDLQLYLNSLQAKYASNKPEVLHTGDYMPGAKWEYSAGDRGVTARLSEGFGTHLVLEARWQDKSEALAELTQKEATSVKKNTYKCLCLVNTAWDRESRDFAVRFNHPKLALYLCELNGGIFYNKENAAAAHYEFWFNAEQKREALSERTERFIKAHEDFTAQDAADALGLNEPGAQKLLSGLEKKGTIIELSFKSDRIKRYARAAKGL